MEENLNNIRLEGVPITSENFNKHWRAAEPYIVRSLQYSDDKYSLDSIYSALHEQEMQLWVAYDDFGLCAFCITQIRSFPLKKVLFLLFVGGREFPDWAHLTDNMKAFALHHKCHQIEFWGRKGWEKLVKPLGFKKINTVFKFNLNCEGTHHV